MSAFNWQCPFCEAHQAVTDGSRQQFSNFFDLRDPSWPPNVGSHQWIILCSNPECAKVSIIYSVRPSYVPRGTWAIDFSAEPIFASRVIPAGTAKIQPEFIPAVLREDYEEACLIRDLSPKASATLTRRCLQGMIRDFCKISKGTLNEEIKTLRKAVDSGSAPSGVSPESVDAIDHVRGVGNIGAHMEKNIDHIVPVDPAEAQVMIDLVESLFEEWYVARDRRAKRFAAVATLADDKKKVIESYKSAPPALPAPDA